MTFKNIYLCAAVKLLLTVMLVGLAVSIFLLMMIYATKVLGGLLISGLLWFFYLSILNDCKKDLENKNNPSKPMYYGW